MNLSGWFAVSTSAVVLQLLMEMSEPMDTLSISGSMFFLVSLIAIATIPMTPAIESMVIIAIGKLLSSGSCSSKLSSLTIKEKIGSLLSFWMKLL